MLTFANIVSSADLMPRKRFIIYLNLLVDSIGWSLIIPTLPYIHSSFNISTLNIGLISSFLAVMIFAFGMMQGRASDYFGRIRMLQLSAFSQLVGHFIIIYAIRSQSLILFIIARCLPAVFKCGMVVSQALLYDISDEADVARNIASLMAYSNLSFVVGPILGGEAYSIHPLLPFYLGIGISVINLGLLGYLDKLLKTKNTMHLNDGSSVETFTQTNSVTDARNRSNSLTHRKGPNRSQQSSPRTGSQVFSFDQSSSPRARSSSLNSTNNHNTANANKANRTLLHYLHIRFAFQLNNSLLESLFAQHVKNALGLSGSSIGRIMAVQSLISALTNGVLLKKLLRVARYPEKFLWLLVLSMTTGLYGWVLSDSVTSVVLSVALTAMSSNLFLNIMQSIIAQSQKQFELQSKLSHQSQHHHHHVSSSSISNARRSGSLSSSTDTLLHKGGAHSSSQSNASIDNDDITSSEDVETETETDDDISALDAVRLRCLSSDSSDFSHSYVDVEALTRDVYAQQHVHLETCFEGAEGCECSSASGDEVDGLVMDKSSPVDDCAVRRPTLVNPQECELSLPLHLIKSQNVDSGSASKVPHYLVSQGSHSIASTPSSNTSIGVVFGLSSTTDRAARIVSPILGGLFVQYCGKMGLIYLITVASLYGMILVVFCLPVRVISENVQQSAASPRNGTEKRLKVN